MEHMSMKAMAVFSDLLNLRQENLFQMMSALQLSAPEFQLLQMLEQRTGSCRSVLEPVFVAHLHDSHMVSDALPENLIDQIRVQQQQLYGQLLEQGHLDHYRNDIERLMQAHQQMGLHKDWYFSAFRKYLAQLWQLQQDDADSQIALPVWMSLIFKLAMFDLGVALQCYAGVSQQRLFDAFAGADYFPEDAEQTNQQASPEEDAEQRVQRVLLQWQSLLQAESVQAFTVLHLKLNQYPFLTQSHPPEFVQQILSVLMRRIRTCLQNNDVIAMAGSGEFLVLLDRPLSYESVLLWYQRIATALRQPLVLLGESLQFSVSAGITVAPQDGQQAGVLWQLARQACMRASGAAALGFCCQPLQQQWQQEQDLIRELRLALQTQQLVLDYQPRYSVPDAQLAGFCVRLRWQHAELEALREEYLLPLALHHGMCGELCRYMLHQAFAAIQHWHTQQFRFGRLILALPDAYVQEPRFAEDVLTIARQYQIRYSDVLLQVQETALSASAAGMAHLQLLAQQGFSWELREFGAGNSSLTGLASLPLHSIQLAGHLLDSWPPSAPQLAMCRAALVLAHGCGLRVSAAVREHAQHWSYLCALGVDQVQTCDSAALLDAQQAQDCLRDWQAAQAAEVWQHRPAWQFL